MIDEPSVFDYGPQHQSTCGLNFQRAGQRRPDFRPGTLGRRRARHRLFARQALPHEAGQDARRIRRQNQLLAVLNMLAADACVSPRGDLVVAVHSGLPDWGSGPQGQGQALSRSNTATATRR